MSSNLTIAIPTFNSAKTIKTVLTKLLNQSANFKVLIFDQGSTDGTLEILDNIKPPWDMKVMKGDIDMARGKSQNIPYMRYKLSQAIDTELVMFLDSDVCLTPHSIMQLVSEFRDRKDVGMMGIRYEPFNNHVMMGATIMKTSDAKTIEWRWDETGCDCNNCAKSLMKKNLSSEFHPHLMAYHLKYQ